jgi:hypothetical protein
MREKTLLEQVEMAETKRQLSPDQLLLLKLLVGIEKDLDGIWKTIFDWSKRR